MSGKAGGTAVTHDPRLTAGEIAALWTTHQESTMTECVYRHFLNNAAAPDIRAVVETDADILRQRAAWVRSTFERENIPVPAGFKDEDVDPGAPRLYSDPFYLYYLVNKTRIAIAVNSMALTTTARPDVRDFYYRCVQTTADVFQRTADLMLEKGLPFRTPFIALSQAVDTVRKRNFLAGFFGDRRPLLAAEISSFSLLVRTNRFGKIFLAGLRQTAGSEKVREYLNEGVELAESTAERFGSVLAREDLPVPASPPAAVTGSRQQPYSDKLIMSQLKYMNAAGLTDKAFIGTTSLRSDLIAIITKARADFSVYARKGIEIMIDNGWLDEPPRLLDRRELAERMH
ncbi:MAG: DUF3231 family protein [bacterium]